MMNSADPSHNRLYLIKLRKKLLLYIEFNFSNSFNIFSMYGHKALQNVHYNTLDHFILTWFSAPNNYFDNLSSQLIPCIDTHVQASQWLQGTPYLSLSCLMLKLCPISCAAIVITVARGNPPSWVTPIEFGVHIVPRKAIPIVEPFKLTPLVTCFKIVIKKQNIWANIISISCEIFL